MSVSAPGKRTITIDSSLHAGSKRNGKHKHKTPADGLITPKLKPNQFIRPSTLKKQLLARIKNHQKRHAQSSSLTASTTASTASVIAPATLPVVTDAALPHHHSQNETFSQSLEYLQSLATKSRETRHKNKTHRVAGVNLAQLQSQPQPQVSLDAFPSQNQVVYNYSNNSNSNSNSNSNNNGNGNSNNNILVAPTAPLPDVSALPFLNQEPQWGCLKSGSKPTFRTFHHKTLKNNTPLQITNPSLLNPVAVMPDTMNMVADMNMNTNMNIVSVVGSDSSVTDAVAGTDTLPVATDGSASNAVAMSESLYGTRQQRLEEYRHEQINAEKKTVQPTMSIKQTKQHIITKKYKLGKYSNRTGPVIGVLIKNVQTQRNVEKKRNEMRRVPLDTIISRLHKKRLLKVGSTAPPDILREMYESAVFAGDIENEGGNDIAMHNFLSGGTNDDTTTA
jgi:hypothetical protein